MNFKEQNITNGASKLTWMKKMALGHISGSLILRNLRVANVIKK